MNDTEFSSAFAKALPGKLIEEWKEDGDLHFTISMPDGRLYLDYWAPDPQEPDDPGYEEMWAHLWHKGKEQFHIAGTREEVETQLTKKYLA